MTADVKITCDGCGSDLTYTSNSVDYRLVLRAEDKSRRDEMMPVTDMYIQRPLDGKKHFCDLGCLKTWVATT